MQCFARISRTTSVYGVTAYMVAQGTNEIGIRIALGADRGKVIHLVLGGAFQRVAAGLVVGLPLVRRRRKVDGGAALWRVVLGPFRRHGRRLRMARRCAFFAAIIPAGRAAAISPMSALRTE